MSATALAPILRATIAPDGRVLHADALIAELQAEAGGMAGGVLAVPQLAAIARLAARLGIVVSRPVVAATGTGNIDMWVQAKPEEGGVEITIIDWRERPGQTTAIVDTARISDVTATSEGWGWQIDTHLRFETVMRGDDTCPKIQLPQPGSRFSAYFRLTPDDQDELPILQAFTKRSAFSRQHATLMQDEAMCMVLSGFPIFDMTGRLSGYRGKAVEVEAEDEPVAAAAPPLDSDTGLVFGRRLDRSLRQPLGRIIANADTISAQQDGPLRPDYAGYANDIAAAGRHLMALVDDLADLQAIDRADFTVAAEDVDLADIARRAAGLLNVKAIDRHITVDVPDESDSALAVGEFRRVLQILVNLIGNAVRYSPEGSRIKVQVKRKRAEARVIVTDQGHGIPAESQERIFEKFERLGRDEAGGSGLGLYISRQLARAMHGDIKVESVPGQGARFILTLPVE